MFLNTFFKRYSFPIIITLFFVYVLIEKLLIFYNFRLGFFDLYYYDHACWNITQGLGPWLEYFNKSFLADHFYAFLYLIAPFYYLVPSPVWLFIAHTLVMLFTLIPILKVARENFGTKGLWITFFMMMATYTFRNQINQDLHGDIVMAPIIAWVVYALIHNRYRTVLILTLLLPFTKENAGLTMIMIGVYLLLFRRKWVYGISIILLGVGSMYVLVHLIIPYFNGGTYRHVAWFRQFGATFGEQLHTILYHPMVVINYLLTAPRIAYVAAMFIPLLGLPFFSSYFILSLGILAQNLLAYGVVTIDIGGHYSAGLVPIFAIATLLVFSKIKKTWSVRKYEIFLCWFKGISTFFIVLNILIFIFMEIRLFWITPHVRAANEALLLIPKDKSVSASAIFYAHLHYRKNIIFFPKIENADFIIVEDRDKIIPDDVDPKESIKKMWKNKEYGAVFYYLIFAQYGSAESLNKQTINNLQHDTNYSLIFNKKDVLVYKHK